MTEKTINVLMAYAIYKESHGGVPPTYREVGSMVGVHSKSTVHSRVQRLLALGLLVEVRPGVYDLAPALGRYEVDWPAVEAAVLKQKDPGLPGPVDGGGAQSSRD